MLLVYLFNLEISDLLSKQTINMLTRHLDTTNYTNDIFNKTDGYNNTINSNLTSNYNITNPNNDTHCKPECYVNCQEHFPNVIEQKYCIENVCHCVVVDESSTTVNTTSLISIYL